MKNTERNVGIDFLRIISMLLIVTAHVFKAGGLLYSPQHDFRFYALWTIEVICACSINFYALLSGYLLVDKPFALHRIIYLWMQVYFYSVGILIIFLIFAPDLVTTSNIYSALLPTVKSNYWYFTAYFCLFFFIPFLNILIAKLDRRGMNMLCIFIILSLSVIPFIIESDIVLENSGYSALWLAGMYVLGAYIKKYGFPKWLHAWNTALLFVLSVTASSLILHYRKTYSINFTEPLILFNSLIITMWVLKHNWKHGISAKIATFVGPLCFSAYIIHSHELIWNQVLNNWFASLIKLNTPVYILVSVAYAFLVLVLCSFIDKARNILFRILRLDRLAKRIDWLLVFCFGQRSPTENQHKTCQ